MRGTWVFRNGKLVPKHEAAALDFGRKAHAVSNLAAPAIRSDKIEKPFISHIDGKTVFDSKSAWERHVRENNCVIVGNNVEGLKMGPSESDFRELRKQVQKDVVDAFDKVEQGYQDAPMERADEIDISAAKRAATDGYLRELPSSESKLIQGDPEILPKISKQSATRKGKRVN